MNLKGRQTLIVGLGVTGIATAHFCWRRGARITAIDVVRNDRTLAAAESLRPMGISVELGPESERCIAGSDLVVLSPGVSHELPALNEARKNGAEVIGEIELAGRFIDAPIIAVTGTNGKTTTTSLLGEMLKAAGISAFVGGNIGEPLIGFVDGGASADWVVAEISSFQLDTMESFRPRIGVILNITDDHLDRYPDFAAYGRSKLKLLTRQEPEDSAILNSEDRFLRTEPIPGKGRRLTFGPAPVAGEGARISDNRITFRFEGGPEQELDLAGCRLSGRHNRENIAAAALAALVAGADLNSIHQALLSFKGLPHRLEWVATIHGVKYFDDSKATNVDAVARALEAFEEPVVLIMGGMDKGGSYLPLKSLVERRVRRLILLGAAAPVIGEALGGLAPIEQADSMRQAVRMAAAAARAGDVVLLSPACSSFDMYANYAERGFDFARSVKALEE
ncbi:MAG: UDP-N-acetylmuramoyl-L-alanine--D-glutamate ligase [Desulfobacterales bacterium]